jgi:hypothetical protein
MSTISDIMKGGISAILIGFGYVFLWCGIFCLLSTAFMDQTGDMENGQMILWCGIGCIVFGLIHMASGIAWYYIVKPKLQTTP